MLTFETEARRNGHTVIAGVDEAGRGPLAGPVVAAAVILPEGLTIDGLTDSKQLSEKKRDMFFDLIGEAAVCVSAGVVDHETIDEINILQAALKAMRIAVDGLTSEPGHLLIDGNKSIDWPGSQESIVKGDAKSMSIAAASVIAKVTRDRIMLDHARTWPGYGFEKHKGYGSKLHRDAITRLGPCPIHRKTFRGVREYLHLSQ